MAETRGTINIADCGCDKTPKSVYEIRIASYNALKEKGLEVGDPPKDYLKEGSDWIYFQKTNYGSEVDKLGSKVAITRGNQQGLYNPYQEDSYNGSGPSYTVWYNPNTLKQVEGSKFDPKLLEVEIPDDSTFKLMTWYSWVDAMEGNPPAQLEKILWMADTIEGAIYRIKFHSWTAGGAGGGFSYSRQLVTKSRLLIDYKLNTGPIKIG